jgi:hypothetical protein
MLPTLPILSSVDIEISAKEVGEEKRPPRILVVVLPTLESVWNADGLSTNVVTTIHPAIKGVQAATPQPKLSVFRRQGNVKQKSRQNY